MWVSAPQAWALGLGRLALQSALGETLQAEIDVTSLSAEEASNLRVRIAGPDAYRAAGVDYNNVLPGTTAELLRRPDGRPYLKLKSDRPVQEPFVDVILEMTWSTGRLVREYTLLLDPPTATARAQPPAAPATTAAPIVAAAPEPVAAPVASPLPAPSPVAAAPAPAAEPSPATTSPVASAPAEAPAPLPTGEPERLAPPRAIATEPTTPSRAQAPAGPDDYMVKRGDTLSEIAARNQRPGVSLDQMLVSLYSANPKAFVGENMNRLRSGVVLALPSADVAKDVSRGAGAPDDSGAERRLCRLPAAFGGRRSAGEDRNRVAPGERASSNRDRRSQGYWGTGPRQADFEQGSGCRQDSRD